MFGAVLLVLVASSAKAQTPFPLNNARDVNPDVQLKLTFDQLPGLGKTGKIRVFEAASNHLVDELDLSIPPGPTERATGAATTAPYLATPTFFSLHYHLKHSFVDELRMLRNGTGIEFDEKYLL